MAPKALSALLLLAAASQAELRVLSYNVRYPNPGDGANRWEARRDLFIESIRQANPDLIGTQELFHLQGQYIVEKLPEFAWFGLSRRGNQTDEHMGVFYRKDRLKPLDSGDFWLSETPEKPASQSWDVTLPRMVTWARFEDLRTGRRFWYFNTHFPHRREDEAARRQCARVIAARLGILAPDAAVIVTGDFNARAGGPVYRDLSMLADAWLTAGERRGPEGTFHGFSGRPGRDRIDWILYRGDWQVRSIETMTFHLDDRYPSDHFPVLAVFE